jgi:hypothetical protein
MKVKDLIKILSQLHQEDEIVIHKEVGDFMGTQPHYKIDHVYTGFDWDDGYVFIKPKYENMGNR